MAIAVFGSPVGSSRFSPLQTLKHRFLGASRDASHEFHILLVPDQPRDGAAKFFCIGMTPEIRKIAALLWLHRLDGAVVSLEKDACSVGFLLQGQSTPVVCEAGELLDELVPGQPEEHGEAVDLFLR